MAKYITDKMNRVINGTLDIDSDNVIRIQGEDRDEPELLADKLTKFNGEFVKISVTLDSEE